jgi:hypothetical protein
MQNNPNKKAGNHTLKPIKQGKGKINNSHLERQQTTKLEVEP